MSRAVTAKAAAKRAAGVLSLLCQLAIYVSFVRVLIEVYLVSSLRRSALGGGHRVKSRDRRGVRSKGRSSARSEERLVPYSRLRAGGSKISNTSIFAAKEVNEGIVLG